MKKNFFLFIFIILSITSNSQELKLINIEDKMSLLFPTDFTINDTLGTKVYSKEIENGVAAISIFQDSKGNINDQKELISFLKGIQDGMIKEANGYLTSESLDEIGSIKINKFTMITNMPEMIQWNINIIRIESTTYWLQFIYRKETNEIPTELKIVNSLQFF